MPTVRDTLQDEKSARSLKAQALEVGESPSLGGDASKPEGLSKNQAQDEEMRAQLFQTHGKSAAIAESEIERLQVRIDQLDQQIKELAEREQPVGKLPAERQDAQMRLDEANDKLARANEAKLNTELTSSLRRENQVPPLHVDHTTHQGINGPQKVGTVIGRNSAQPSAPLRKQHSHGINH